jgi:hypothetical protein
MISCTDDIYNSYYESEEPNETECAEGHFEPQNSIEFKELYPYTCINGYLGENIHPYLSFSNNSFDNLEKVKELGLDCIQRNILDRFPVLIEITEILLISTDKTNPLVSYCDACDFLDQLDIIPKEIRTENLREDSCKPDKKENNYRYMDFDRDCKAYLADK